MNEATAVSSLLAIFATIYWLHSTLLLSGCWALSMARSAPSHYLTDRVWKLASVLGLLTALLHITIGNRLPFRLTTHCVAIPVPVDGETPTAIVRAQCARDVTSTKGVRMHQPVRNSTIPVAASDTTFAPSRGEGHSAARQPRPKEPPIPVFTAPAVKIIPCPFPPRVQPLATTNGQGSSRNFCNSMQN
jgi:hypothetical protein